MGYSIRPNYERVYELPPRLEDWIPQDHPARFLRDVVDALDLIALGFKDRSVERGRPPLSTELLVKAWVYGFVEGFRSTRRLEWACANVPAAIWATGDERPDHNSLARGFRENVAAFRVLFRKVVVVAAEAGLMPAVFDVVDGTKVTAASSMHTALHRDKLRAALTRLEAAIQGWWPRSSPNPRAPPRAAAACPRRWPRPRPGATRFARRWPGWTPPASITCIPASRRR